MEYVGGGEGSAKKESCNCGHLRGGTMAHILPVFQVALLKTQRMAARGRPSSDETREPRGGWGC